MSTSEVQTSDLVEARPYRLHRARANFFAGLGFTLLPLLLALRYLNSQSDSRTYGPSHWFLTYQDGFVRRGLIGQCFAQVAFLSWHRIFLLEAALLLTVTALTYMVFRRSLFGTLDQRRFAAFLLAAPAFLPHLAYLGGEMDSFLYIAALLGAVALVRLSSSIGLVIASVCAILGLLMHEAFLFLFFPLLLILALDLVHRRRLSPILLCFHIATVSVAFAVIVHFGRLHASSLEWIARAQQRTNMPIEGAVFVALHNTFAEQLRFVAHLYTPKLLAGIIAALLLSIPYGLILFRLTHAALRRRGYSTRLTRVIILLFLLPLALVPLGHDVMRWFSAIAINVSLFLLFLAEESFPSREEPGPPLTASLTHWTSTPIYAATLLYLTALGPWGIASNRLLSGISDLLKH